jgi:hypothetical protein
MIEVYRRFNLPYDQSKVYGLKWPKDNMHINLMPNKEPRVFFEICPVNIWLIYFRIRFSSRRIFEKIDDHAKENKC